MKRWLFVAIVAVLAGFGLQQLPSNRLSLFSFLLQNAVGQLFGLDLLTVDRREGRLLAHVLRTAAKGNASAVLESMDSYSWNKEWFMASGDRKGVIVQTAIWNMTQPPMRALELGTYCGYGSIRIAMALPKEGVLHTVEPNAYNAGIARQIIDHAGLSHKIRVLEGKLQDVLPVIQSEHSPLDFVFIDHIKRQYVPDLKLLMSTPGLLHPGTVVAADNMYNPGAPEYLAYMASDEGRAAWETVLHDATVEYTTDVKDAVAVSVLKSVA